MLCAFIGCAATHEYEPVSELAPIKCDEARIQRLVTSKEVFVVIHREGE